MTDPVSKPTTTPADPARARQPWVTPVLARIVASDAELGANPAGPEGLAKGS
jgi:hypothetical protein